MNPDELQSALLNLGVPTLARRLLHAPADPCDIAKSFLQAMNDIYWKSRNARGAIQLGLCGLTYALLPTGDEPTRSVAKELAYNIASFAWPGWAESDITLTDSEIALGSDAAKLNLQLAVELHRPLKGVANALWMLGAYAIVYGRKDDAVRAFELAGGMFTEAQDRAAALMCIAYARLATAAVDVSMRPQLDASVAALRAEGTDDAVAYSNQVETAATVFCRAC